MPRDFNLVARRFVLCVLSYIDTLLYRRLRIVPAAGGRPACKGQTVVLRIRGISMALSYEGLHVESKH